MVTMNWAGGRARGASRGGPGGRAPPVKAQSAVSVRGPSKRKRLAALLYARSQNVQAQGSPRKRPNRRRWVGPSFIGQNA
eukprot:7937959-Alexandrium_andersonii.AAC.1